MIDSGRAAVLDATFSDRRHRDRARSWAAGRGVPAFCVETRCAADVALERLARRAAARTDPSDAGPSFHRTSVEAFEDLDEWPPDALFTVRTDAPDWRARVRRLAGRIARVRSQAG